MADGAGIPTRPAAEERLVAESKRLLPDPFAPCSGANIGSGPVVNPGGRLRNPAGFGWPLSRWNQDYAGATRQRIAVYVPAFEGGGEKTMLDLARAFDVCGYKVDLLCGAGPPENWPLDIPA